MISAGGRHSLALAKDGSVWAWGNNEFGQLGDGTHETRGEPFRVAGVDHLCQISAGYDHSVALRDDGSVLAWGDNNLGQLGNSIPEATSVPVQMAGWDGPLKDVETIQCGGYHTLFISRDRILFACGHNTFGQLGDWKLADSCFPSKVWKQLFQ